MDLNKLEVYDIEIFANVFTIYIGNAGTRQCKGYEISDRKDQRKAMINHLRKIAKKKHWMVGFNNLFFDYSVLHYILENQNCRVQDIYQKAQAVIEAEGDDVWKHTIRANNHLIRQLDLYKIHHFDNNARRTSLKILEFNMLSDNIEDLPYEPGSTLSSDQIDKLLKYNKHDLLQTFLFLKHSMKQINFREELTEKYDRNFMNHNDTKIGKDYFIMRMEEASPGSCYDLSSRKVQQTRRKNIPLKDCIFDYIKFDRPEFKAVRKWLAKQTIKKTKGVFNDILEHELGDLAQYCEMKTKQKKLSKEPTEKQVARYKEKNPSCWIEERTLSNKKVSHYLCWNVAENLNCVVDGLRYDFGTGGLHAATPNTIYEKCDDYVIGSWDVKSYYPNMAISNMVYPQHLGEVFCEIYKDVYDQRISYAKGTVENLMLKLALNGVYGDSNNQFSPFYDPKYTMTITIGGQLSLCMLAEKLLEIPTLRVIMVNTDGLEFIVHPDHEEKASEVCKEWEKITKLELEGDRYHKLCIRDCNSYIGVFESGEIKRKGAYAYVRPQEEDAELGWHQNHSMIVVAKAAEAHLLGEEGIEYFIENHRNKWDFMLRTKVPRSSRLVITDEDDDERLVQNTTRYYISEEGEGELTKIMPPLPEGKPAKRWVKDGEEILTSKKPEENRAKKNGYTFVEDTVLPPQERRIGINTGWKVKVCNDIKHFDWDINYNFYIEEAKKLALPLTEYRSDL